MVGRKCKETQAWSSTHTNTHTNKGSVKQTSRPNASPTPSPGFDGLTGITIGRRRLPHKHALVYMLMHAYTYVHTNNESVYTVYFFFKQVVGFKKNLTV